MTGQQSCSTAAANAQIPERGDNHCSLYIPKMYTIWYMLVHITCKLPPSHPLPQKPSPPAFITLRKCSTSSHESRENLEGLWNFSWRPRPPSFLPPAKERDIVKNLKAYAKRYEDDDELLLAAAGSEQLERRTQLRKLWEEWMSGKDAWLQRQNQHLARVRSLPGSPAHRTRNSALPTLKTECKFGIGRSWVAGRLPSYCADCGNDQGCSKSHLFPALRTFSGRDPSSYVVLMIFVSVWFFTCTSMGANVSSWEVCGTWLSWFDLLDMGMKI